MAVVDVGIAVTDLYLLSDQVELTDVVDQHGQPVFQRDLYRLDYAALRVTQDVWHVIKSRKAIFADDTHPRFLPTEHAYINPPVNFLETF